MAGQTVPAKAGTSSLLVSVCLLGFFLPCWEVRGFLRQPSWLLVFLYIQSQLKDGNVVILQSRAGGKTLRSLHGTAQGVGGFGTHGQ